MKKLITIAIALAMLATMILPITAIAATNGTVDVSGTITQTLEIIAPTGLDPLGNLIGSDDTGDITAATPGTVTCIGYPSGYTLEIVSDKADGKLESVSSAGTFLDTALAVTSILAIGDGGAVSYNNHPSAEAVTTTPIVMGTGASALSGTNSISLKVKQAKQATADAAGSYTLKLTWTVSAN